jgi:hypothetical protein
LNRLSVHDVMTRKRVHDVVALNTYLMRGILITYALDQGLHVIGQVRRDTALFLRASFFTAVSYLCQPMSNLPFIKK